jgi:thymidylate kinase
VSARIGCPLLVAVEGKSIRRRAAEAERVHARFRAHGHEAMLVREPDLELAKTIARIRARRRLGAVASSLLGAAEFSVRYHEQILPAVERAAVVVADGYVGSAIASELAAGLPKELVDALYAFARPADITLWTDEAEAARESAFARVAAAAVAGGT